MLMKPMTIRFTGTKAWIYGYCASWSGIKEIKVNGLIIGPHDNSIGAPPHPEQNKKKFLFDIDYYTHNEHVISIKKANSDTKSVGISGFYYLSNGERGNIELTCTTFVI